MKYNKATITDVGIDLLSELTTTSGTLRLSQIKLGNGQYASSENLKSRTLLKSLKQSFDEPQVERISDNQIRMTLVATNEGLTDGYYMTEMGVFALNTQDEEILLAIAVAFNEAEADYMPADDQGFPASITIFSDITVSNNVNVTPVVETGYAPIVDYLETKRKVNLISVSDDGEGNVVLTLPI